jgi:hypothetical protein
MQKTLQTVSVVVSSIKNDADTSRVKSAPVELDAAQLKQIGGGLGPNGTWSDSTSGSAAGPNGTW